MSAGPLLGQGAGFARALARARRLELAHAVVIEGAPGTGKSHAAIELARALLCPVDGAEPCRACAVCRRVDTGNHPDLHRLEPPPDKVAIPVEQVRELQQRLARAPVEA